MSISKPSSIDSPFSISTLPKSKSKSSSSSSSSSINSLYEIEYVPGDQMPETTLPLVNPYEYFAKKPSAFSVRGVRELIRPSSNKKVMEYVQSSKFSSCQVPATEEEQFISLTIPEKFLQVELNGFPDNFEAASFFVDEEKKVAVVSEQVRIERTETSAYIIGQICPNWRSSQPRETL